MMMMIMMMMMMMMLMVMMMMKRNQSHYELMENVTEMTDSHRTKQRAHCGIIIWPF